MANTKSKEVVIIGGGFAGCLTALMAAKSGFQVTLLEAQSQLFRGASSRSWGRLHLGQMSADKQSIAMQALQNDLFAAPFLQHFFTTPKQRPIYVIDKKGDGIDIAQYAEGLHQLTTAFEAQLEVDPSLSALPLTKEPFWKKLSPKEVAGLTSLDAIAYSSNEVMINTTQLAAAIEHQVRNHPNITIIASTKVIRIQHRGKQFQIAYRNLIGQRSILRTEGPCINATWDNGPSIEKDVIPANVIGNNCMYRMQLYGIVEGVVGELYSYVSLIGRDETNLFILPGNQAVIEVQSLSRQAEGLTARPADWDIKLGTGFGHLDSVGKEKLERVLAKCREQFPATFPEEASLTGAYFGSFWAQQREGSMNGKASDQIGFEPYRATVNPEIGYFPIGAEKVPMIFISAMQIIADIIEQYGSIGQKKVFSNLSASGEKRKIRDYFIDLLDLTPISPRAVQRYRGRSADADEQTIEALLAKAAVQASEDTSCQPMPAASLERGNARVTGEEAIVDTLPSSEPNLSKEPGERLTHRSRHRSEQLSLLQT